MDQRGDPLPYYVRVRAAASDDSSPRRHEWKGYAYSAMEAVMQTLLELGGHGEQSNAQYKVEEVRPDLEEYLIHVTKMALRSKT